MSRTLATTLGITTGVDQSVAGITIGRYSGGYTNAIIDTDATAGGLDLRVVSAAVMQLFGNAVLTIQPLGVNNVTPTSPLHVAGPVAVPITTVTSNTTLNATHSTVINNRGASNTLTLPAASGCAGRKYHIVTIQAQTVVSASSNVVPRAGGAAGTAILPATDGAWAIIQSDGSNWLIIASGP